MSLSRPLLVLSPRLTHSAFSSPTSSLDPLLERVVYGFAKSKKLLVLALMHRIHAYLSPLSVPSWSLVLPMLSTLLPTMLVALFLSSYPSGLVVLQLLLTLLALAALLVLSQVACKSSHMCLNLPVETMDILITADTMTDLIRLPAKATDNHMLPMAKLLSSSLLFQCTMVDHQSSEATEVLDLSNLGCHIKVVPNPMPVPLLSRCKVFKFLASR